jgi:hypothetical protein
MEIIIAVLLLAGGAIFYSYYSSNVEQANYQTLETHGPIEIRDYAPMLVAATEVAGEREVAINSGFRTIAEYIFGGNLSAEKVAMTAPVTQQNSEKIAMTAPVTQQEAAGKWQVRFVMPAGYTLDSLPKPNNPNVRIEAIDAKRFAVIRFSGIADKQNIAGHTQELEKFLLDHDIAAIAKPTFAFYNPPWTLPFMRRNEIMLEIARRTDLR